jgi:hypothetical protein
MNQELTDTLNKEVQLAASYFLSLPQEIFFARSIPEKWSPAENVQHLILSVRPLVLAFSLPMFLVRIFFGRPNRHELSYHAVVERYKAKLEAGGKASAPFIPKKQTVPNTQQELIGAFVDTYEKFQKKVSAIPTDKLNQYVLPHPILGKLTFREMIFFTIYHVSHHHALVKGRLSHA